MRISATKLCARCAKPRPLHSFRRKLPLKNHAGEVYAQIGRMTDECAYCFRERMSHGGEFLLAHRAKMGKISFVVANERRKRRELRRREKIGNRASYLWAKRQTARRNAHPLIKEHRRVAAIVRALRTRLSVNGEQHKAGEAVSPVFVAPLAPALLDFFTTYHAKLKEEYGKILANPALITKSNDGKKYQQALLSLQEWAHKAWSDFTPEERGRFAYPRKITQ